MCDSKIDFAVKSSEFKEYSFFKMRPSLFFFQHNRVLFHVHSTCSARGGVTLSFIQGPRLTGWSSGNAWLPQLPASRERGHGKLIVTTLPWWGLEVIQSPPFTSHMTGTSQTARFLRGERKYPLPPAQNEKRASYPWALVIWPRSPNPTGPEIMEIKFSLLSPMAASLT